MKKMRTLAAIMLLATAALTACTDYQDEIDALKNRVFRLETLVDETNTNLFALYTLADALEERDYVTEVTELADGTGYVIVFEQAGSVIVKNGKDGKDGLDGKDAQLPDISM